MRRAYDGVARLRLANSGGTQGWLEFGAQLLPCAIGRGGLRHRKREGDGGTPAGLLALREVFYRPDRVRQPLTPHRTSALRPDDGWCDAAGDRNYNRPVPWPYTASAEAMWREDGLYDIVGILNYNIAPRGRGRGSAIFLHVARPDWAPTEGCIALRMADLLRLLEGALPLRAIDTRV